MTQEKVNSEKEIIKEIWENRDVVMVIFAGAAAEFSVSKAVDWLFFTGKLPADPIGRLFSTVAYAQSIIFQTEEDAKAALQKINQIHGSVEQKRGFQIPNWAYLDVLFMLVDYSIRAFEILERPLTETEKLAVLETFIEIGNAMNISNLPQDFDTWQLQRTQALNQNYAQGKHSMILQAQYKKALGSIRYELMLSVQRGLVPEQIADLLDLGKPRLIKLFIPVYKLLKKSHLNHITDQILLPKQHQEQINKLGRK